MERIIVLSDIHSNLPALISVFSHLEITEMDAECVNGSETRI